MGTHEMIYIIWDNRTNKPYKRDGKKYCMYVRQEQAVKQLHSIAKMWSYERKKENIQEYAELSIKVYSEKGFLVYGA